MPSRRPTATSTVSLLLLLAAAISDAGMKHGLWLGPTIYVVDYYSVVMLLKGVVSISILTGLLALVEDRLGKMHHAR